MQLYKFRGMGAGSMLIQVYTYTRLLSSILNHHLSIQYKREFKP